MEPRIKKAVVVVAIEENGEYRGCKLADFKNSPRELFEGNLLFRGNLKNQADDNKYGVDLLGRYVKTEYFAETSLGIPVEVQNETDEVVVGVVNWNSDFDAEEIEVYTDLGMKTVHKSAIKRIKSWVVPQEQK